MSRILVGTAYVLWRDVVSQALVGGLAQRARLRALAVVDACDQPRLDEARQLRRLAAIQLAGLPHLTKPINLDELLSLLADR